MIVTLVDTSIISGSKLGDALSMKTYFPTDRLSDRGVILLIVNICFLIIIMTYITYGC